MRLHASSKPRRSADESANSRLIVFGGLRNDEGEDAAHFYLFDCGKFVFSRSVRRDGGSSG